MHPLYLVLGSGALAAGAAMLLLVLLALSGARGDVQTISALGVVVVAVSVAMALKLSVVMALLGMGILTRALDHNRRFLAVSFGYVGELFIMALFALTGATLDLDLGATALAAGLGLAAARALGKAIPVLAFAKPSGLSYRKASLVSVGLLPMSGAAVAMAHEAASIWPSFEPQFGAVVLAAVLILELLGPLAVQFALRRSGDAADAR
jgi:Kef-type K+ transport system membrane component KefB